MAPPSGLLRINPDQTTLVAGLLARAFQDDPMMVAAFPNAARRARSLPRLNVLSVRYVVRYGEVYATPGMEGAALWLPPERARVSVWGMLRMGALALPLTVSWAALWRLGTLEARASKLHHHYAPMPHWYLVQIGVEPAFQGRGFAGRLLRPLLARMDAADVPCYLETSKERNVTLYQRFGFAIAGVADVGNSLRIWAMVRRPAKA